MNSLTRRRFLRQSAALGAGAALLGPMGRSVFAAEKPGSKMRIGLVTYLWAKDWDLPTIIERCEKSKVLGVELRSTHAHGVEPEISQSQRKEVKARFDDSPVVFVGPGSAEEYHHADQDRLKQAIEDTKKFIVLSHDCGGSGVKVRPNNLPKEVPVEETIAQIARSLNTVGKFAADYGQEIRLEVHGQCSPPPLMNRIMEQVTEPNVGACWNCNGQDLQGEGFQHNFDLLKDDFGHTVHVREMNQGDYPYAELIENLVAMDYPGWVLLECRTKIEDPIAALVEQRKIFEELVARAQSERS